MPVINMKNFLKMISWNSLVIDYHLKRNKQSFRVFFKNVFPREYKWNNVYVELDFKDIK